MKDNIFDFLRISRKETIHSQFIVSVMQEDPLYLEMFLDIIGCKDFLDEDKPFVAETEVTLFPKDKDTPYGRADIWIGNSRYNGNKRIIIENKIDASDQHLQLSRYREYLDEPSSGRDGLLFYLTLEEKPANIYSSKNKDYIDFVSNDAKVGYQRISYQNHIIPWLDRIKDITVSKYLPNFIDEYKGVVNSLTRIQKAVSDGKCFSEISEGDRVKFCSLLELYFWNCLAEMIFENKGVIDSRRRYSYDKIYKRHKSNIVDRAYGLIIGNVRIKVDNDHKSNDLIFSKGEFNQEGFWVDKGTFDRFKLMLSNISTSEDCACKVYEILQKSNI